MRYCCKLSTRIVIGCYILSPSNQHVLLNVILCRNNTKKILIIIMNRDSRLGNADDVCAEENLTEAAPRIYLNLFQSLLNKLNYYS